MNHRTSAAITGAAPLLLLLTGCVAQAAVQPQAPECRPPGKAVLPHTSGTLTKADNSALICLAPGQQIAVFLSAPPDNPSDRWQPITAQPDTAVKRGNSGVMTLPVGATAGLFIPTAPGRIELSSRQRSGATWHATLVVR